MLDLNKPLVFAATGHRAYYIGMSKEGRIVVETETGHLSSIHPLNSHLLENIPETVTKEPKTLRACELEETGFYFQRDDDNCEWGVNYVGPNFMTVVGGCERLPIFGQFRGPIQLPEVK